MVKIAGLDSNNEFEAESVKDHIKNLAASAVDVSGLARREDVDSITQKIESGELKGEPGETVGVFGEADATLVDGTLTIDPNHAVVNVPRISGTVTVNIADVVLPDGVESDNGVQVTLMMEGVDEGAEISWPVGTVTHDESLPGKHVALLMRTAGHWEVFFPPLSKASVDDIASSALFSENFPALYRHNYDYETGGDIKTPVSIQEQISGSYYDSAGDEQYFGVAYENVYADPQTISYAVNRLSIDLREVNSRFDHTGRSMKEGGVNYRGVYEEPGEFESYNYPYIIDSDYVTRMTTWKPASGIKVIDGVPHFVHWEPIWSENMRKFLDGDMTASEFVKGTTDNPKPYEPYPTYKPDPKNPGQTIVIEPTKEELDKYRNDLDTWSRAWQMSPLYWEAYTVPMTRDTSLDKKATGSGIRTDGEEDMVRE